MKVNIKNILLVAWNEYVKWIATPKMIVILVVLIPIREMVILPLITASDQMCMPINILEPCIGTVNSWVGVMLITLSFIILSSSFPTMDGNMFFYISRMGRSNWIIGEMLFQLLSAVSYCVIIMVGIVVQTASVSFFGNGWSIVVTDYDAVCGDMATEKLSGIVPPSLYFQITPYKAFLLSFVLLFLMLLFCSLMFLIGCMYSKKLLLFFMVVVQISIGCGFIWINNKGMWFFPISHSMLQLHYHKCFREYVFPPRVSIVLLLVAEIVFMVIIYRKAKKVSLDMIEGSTS